jgi:hypothetical protein
MTAPTLADFRARHVAFAETPDATVEAYLEDAAKAVADYIPEDIRPRCVMLLAAHELALEGFGDASSAGLAEAKAAGAKKAKDGATEIEFFLDEGSSRSQAEAVLSSTSYGRRYLAIREPYRPIGFVA